MYWWVWVIVGIGLFCLELFITTGFVLLFFGLSCLVVGLLVYAQFLDLIWQQLAVFGLLSFIFFVGLRRFFSKNEDDDPEIVEAFEEEQVEVLEAVLPGHVGKGTWRGTPCSVRNLGKNSLEIGKIYKVANADGIILEVKEVNINN